MQEYNVPQASSLPTLATLSTEYLRGPDLGGGVGGMVCSIRDGEKIFSHSNHRGDVIARTDGNGSLTWYAVYEAYGTRPFEWSDGTTGNPDRQMANTKDEEAELGLLNEGMRYRDLETGTFLTRDPIRYADGPNMYCYVHCNPITYFDPLGLNWFTDAVDFVKNVGVEAGKQAVALRNRVAEGAKETVLMGSDLVTYGIASAAGYGEEYEGQSKLFKDIYNNPQNYDADQLRADICFGTIKSVANVGTLGGVSLIEGSVDMANGNYQNAQDAFLTTTLMATGGAIKKGGSVKIPVEVPVPAVAVEFGGTVTVGMEVTTVVVDATGAVNALGTSAQAIAVMMSGGDYPRNADDWNPPEGWTETSAGEKTDGKNRQWVDEEGKMRRRWDREGREGGKERGPHWHDLDDESGGVNHIDPDD